MKIILSEDKKQILVDDDVFNDLKGYSWSLLNTGYAYRREMIEKVNHQYTLHRLVVGAIKGDEVDHINGNKLDNRRSNLRLVTHQQNMRNRSSKANKYGYKGINKTPNGRYYACIRLGKGKAIKSTRCNTPLEAAALYNELAKKYFGEYARLNVLP